MPSKRTRLLASSVLMGAVFGAAAAAQAQQSTTVQEVVVTGSRIPRPNTTAVSPVQTVGQQEFKLEGTVDTEQLLNNLPSVSPSTTQFANNGATGIATVDLRGFGPTRTLVLVDGRRMPPGDPSQPVADLNLIPSSLVDSVDVMTGGAASIYGSDAIAGVVNFKMKHNFEGVQLDAQYDFAQHDNSNSAADAIAKGAGQTAPSGDTIQGRTEHITITFGANSPDGKGNLEGYLGYVNQAPVRQSAYDYGYCALGNTGPRPAPGGQYYVTGHYCGGSSNSAYGKFVGDYFGHPDNFNQNGTWNAAGDAGKWDVTNTQWLGAIQKVGGAPILDSKTKLPIAQDPTAPSAYNLSNNPGAAGNFVSYDNNTPPGAASRTWNYAPYQYFMRQDTRYQGGYFAHYDVNEHVQAYSDFMFQDDHSTGQLAASGLFWTNGAINQISCNNGLASAAQLAAICGPTPYTYYPNGPKQPGITVGGAGTSNLSQPMEIGYRMAGEPRNYILTHDSFKMDEGVKGAIDDTWSYDAYVQFGKSTSQSTTTGDVSKQKIANALNVNAQGQCAGGQAGCIPLNIFQPLSQGITQQQFNYIAEDASVSGYTTEQVASANLVGKLGNYGVKSPWANEGVGIALGAEYRRDYISVAPDAATVSGDLSGTGVSGTQKTQGAVSVKDLYGELNIPIIQDRFLMKDVTIDTSYRRSDYNLAGTSGTYKFGGDWQVDQNLRFRGSFARSERAPNVLELFTPNSVINASYSDPCAGANPSFTAAQCYASAKNLQALGVTEAQFQSKYYGNISPCAAGQCNGLAGGNEHLHPEIADTTTVGFVATPKFIPGFYASVDYWDIHVMNEIQAAPANAVLVGCLENPSSNLCNLISRDYTTGGFSGTDGYVVTQEQNIGGQHKRGYDFQTDYRFRLKDVGLADWGSIDQDFSGTYLIADVTEIPGESPYNCAGLYGLTCSTATSGGGGGVPEPRWRSKYRITWATPWKVDFSLQWRYIAQVKADVNSIGNPVLSGNNTQVGGTTIIDAKIPAYSYIDLAASWRVKDNITLRMGVNNLFDKDPPQLDTTSYPLTSQAGNTYPAMYDPLGRTIFINLTAKY